MAANAVRDSSRGGKIGLLAGLGLVLLFPGFFLYHNALAAGVFPAVLGGFFSPIALLSLIAILPMLVATRGGLLPTRGARLFTLLFVVFVAFTVAWTLLHYFLDGSREVRIATTQVLLSTLQWSGLFVVGAFVPMDSPRLKKGMLLALGSMFFIVASYVATSGSLFYYARQAYDVASDGDAVATYQGFARSALVTAAFILAVVQKPVAKALIIMASLFMLFVLGSRSDLYAFIVVAVLINVVGVVHQRRNLAMVAVLGVALACAVIVSWDSMSTTRQATVGDLENDASWQARQRLADMGYAQLRADPAFGEFAGHIERGGPGNYIHNLFSTWASFGPLGFALYLALILLPLLHSFREYVFRRQIDPRWAFVFYMSVVTVLLAFLARSVFWPIPALTCGLYVNALRHRSVRLRA
jgi:hypothetical protein